MSLEEDYNLILKLKQNDESALKQIYNTYSDRVYNFSFFILKDTGWSEDIVQDVFMRFWHSRMKLDPKGNLWNYFYVITKRLSLNKLRDIISFDSSFEHIWENISNLSDCSHQKLLLKELSHSLDKILADLPERQREVFKMNKLEGFTYKQIADTLKISPNTVKNHMIQALKTVKKEALDIDYLVLLCFLL